MTENSSTRSGVALLATAFVRCAGGLALATLLLVHLHAQQPNPTERSSPDPTPVPPVPITIKGIGYQSYLQGGFADSTQTPALDYVAASGANWMSFNTPFVVDLTSGVISARPGVTDFEGLTTAIRRAQQRMLRTLLYVFVQTPTFGSLIGDANRPQNIDGFFTSFAELVLRYADLAQQEGVDILVLGNEMNALSGPNYRDRWTALIAEVRQRYQGRISYDAVPNGAAAPQSLADVSNLISFWDLLDLISFSVYPRLSNNEVPTRDDIEQGWISNVFTGSNILRNLKAWNSLTGKPILFNEIGYQSVNGAAINPGTSAGGQGIPNQPLQALLFDVMFNQVSQEAGPWLEGIFVWAGITTWTQQNSPGYYTGGFRAVDFSVFEKQAAGVVTSWYSPRPTGPFTDDPLVPGSSAVRAVHISELRARINYVRTASGLLPYVWTDSTLKGGETVIRGIHLMELRFALAEVYARRGRPVPIFTDAAVIGIPISVAHISELRAAVLAVE